MMTIEQERKERRTVRMQKRLNKARATEDDAIDAHIDEMVPPWSDDPGDLFDEHGAESPHG